MLEEVATLLALVSISVSPRLCLNCMSALWQAGGSTGLLMDLAANEKAVHSDFFNGK